MTSFKVSVVKTSVGNYEDTSLDRGPFTEGGLITAIIHDKRFESKIRFGEIESKVSGCGIPKGVL